VEIFGKIVCSQKEALLKWLMSNVERRRNFSFKE